MASISNSAVTSSATLGRIPERRDGVTTCTPVTTHPIRRWRRRGPPLLRALVLDLAGTRIRVGAHSSGTFSPLTTRVGVRDSLIKSSMTGPNTPSPVPLMVGVPITSKS